MKINGVHREDGQVMYFRLDDGKILTKQQCISYIKAGDIDNGAISRSKKGEEFVRSKKRNQKLDEFGMF